MRFDLADWDAAVRMLGDASGITAACHLHPDGDALGSLLGAALGLAKLGKKVQATWPGDDVELPYGYRFLPGAHLLRKVDEVEPAPVFLALDCGAADRLGVLEDVARASGCVVNVDHHPGNDRFGNLNLVAPTVSSTAEIVYGLLIDAGVDMDPDIATCLYTGIVTDTGRFSYSNCGPETLRLAAELLSVGVPATQIAQDVFESAPFGYLKLLGRVLERARLLENERFVYSWITRADLAETGVELDETEKLIDAVRSTRDAEVAAMFKEQPDGSYRVSLRSKGPASVGAIARANGGGGHELAAGFTAAGVDEGVAAILEGLG